MPQRQSPVLEEPSVRMATPERVEDVDGRAAYIVRCRAPIVWNASDVVVRETDEGCGGGKKKRSEGADAGGGEGEDADEGGGEVEEGGGGGAEDDVVVEGVASSTSKDWYGTEMTKNALEGMAAQFNTRKVPYVKSHWDSEWDDVLGDVVEASVDRATVAEPVEPAEMQYVLNFKAVLDVEDERVVELRRRVKKGRKVGQSVGGWITELRFIMDDTGEEIERILIEGLELDHLAVTRKPANPDSWIGALRTAIGQMEMRSREIPVDPPAPVADPPTTETTGSEMPREDAVPAVEPNAVSANDTLDTGSVPVQDHSNGNPDGSDDAHRGVTREAGAQPPTEEDSMTPEELRATMAELLQPLSQRLDAIEARSATTPAPAPAAAPAPSDEIADLRARLDRAEKNTARMVLAAERGGSRYDLTSAPAIEFGQGMDEIVRAVEQAGDAPTLIAMCKHENGAILRAVSDPPADPAIARRTLSANLRTFLRAAENDGLVRTPFGCWLAAE